MNKVVKCKKDTCAQHFMYTEKSTRCPFCRTEYAEVIEKETKDLSALPAQAGKRGPAKAKKESFKMEW